MHAYLDLLNRGTQVSQTPFSPYTGNEVAPINAQQQSGVSGANTLAGGFAPYAGNAGSMINNAGQAVNGNDINQYMDPYTQSVINATQADFDVQNKRAQSATTGNAAAQGALGGDRVGVAQALTQEGQERVQAPVMAGLRSSGWQNAVTNANAQKNRELQAGSTLAGTAGTAANQQFGFGTAEQQTTQAQYTQAMTDYYTKQGYPFATAQWLAGIVLGTGAQMGSTSQGTSTTQGPQPNQFLQAAGLGVAGLGAFAKDGGRIKGFAEGGNAIRIPPGFAGGGTPYGPAGQGWVPTLGSIGGHALQDPGPPKAPNMLQPQGMPKDMGKNIGNIGKSLYDSWGSSYPTYDWNADPAGGLGGVGSDSTGGYRSGGSVPVSTGFAGGGSIRGFEVGGTPSFYDDVDATDMPPIRYTPSTREEKSSDYNAARLSGAGSPDESNTIASNASLLKPPDETRTAGFSPDTESFDKAVDVGRKFRQDNPFEKVAAGRGFANRAEPPDGALGFDSSGTSGVVPPRITIDRGRNDPTFVPGAGASTKDRQAGLFGLNMSDEARQGLISMGLGMMANRVGGKGSFLSGVGQAGEQGMTTYASARAATAAQQLQARKEAFEREKFERPYQEMTQAEKMQEKVRQLTQQRADERAARDDKRLDMAEKREQRAADTQKLLLDPTSGLDPKVKDAMAAGVHGKEFLDVLDPVERNIVEGAGNYEISPYAAVSKLKGTAERKMALIRQFNPDYDDNWYKNRGTVLKNFFASTSPNSPVVQARQYNTAMGHAGELADAIATIQKTNPGILLEAQKSGTPILSYLAAQARQRAAKGTPEGEAWNTVNAITPLYVAETTKFYSGSTGSLEEKKAIGAPLDSNLSFPELIGALRAQSHMFKSKTEPMEQEFKDAMDAPGMREYGTKGTFKEWHVTKSRAEGAQAKIEQLYNDSHQQQPQQAVPKTAPKTPPADRFRDLVSQGMSKADAYKQMHAEGYQ